VHVQHAFQGAEFAPLVLYLVQGAIAFNTKGFKAVSSLPNKIGRHVSIPCRWLKHLNGCCLLYSRCSSLPSHIRSETATGLASDISVTAVHF